MPGSVGILEGSGRELLAQADKWQDGFRLKLIEIAEPDYRTKLPDDVVWEGAVPLIPRRGRTAPITTKMAKEWIGEENGR